MSELKATPGPWVPMLGEVYRIRASDGSVATVQHVHLTGRRPDHEVVANANLIAASPALYEALEMQARAEVENANCPDCDGEGDWSHCARCSELFGPAIDSRTAALAKARGESIHTRELNHEGGGQ